MSMSRTNGYQPRIAIIGAGMAGILTVIKLREAGYRNFVVYEKTDRVGGTWRENTYPGVACDVPAHLYTYSFEPNPDWSQTFASGPEIQAYFERVARKYDIHSHIRFNEAVPYCAYENGRWHLKTSTGREDFADVVIAATGVLHHPHMADIPGLQSFKGACFHTARWDHSVPLEGKRVGVIGTGSTAIQITTALVKKVARFDLFQRTAQWVMPIENKPYTEEEKAAFRSDPAAIEQLKVEANAYFRLFSDAVIDADSREMADIEAACLKNLEDNVKDPVLREKLRPNYRAGCKRLIFAPDFYQNITQPNANVITDSIERIEPEGVRTADGVLHELDVLVVATGFKADSFIRPTTVLGRKGVNLDDVWEDHPIAYMSITIPEFPNFFMLNGPNGPVGNFSLISIAEAQVAYILDLMSEAKARHCREITVRRQAAESWEGLRREAAKKSIWSTGCRSWYLDKHGVPASWPWSRDRFFEEMKKPELEAFEFA